MVCHSLRHRGEELLGQRDGLEAYARIGKTMGIPFLHPWANRLGGLVSYEALGRHVDLQGKPLRVDGETGLPMHGTIPRPLARGSQPRRRRQLDAAPAEDVPVRAHRASGECRSQRATLRITTTIEAPTTGRSRSASASIPS